MKAKTQPLSSPNHQDGFTLTELIITLVIMGILAAVVTPLIGNKFSAAAQSSQRAQWVQQAEIALFHIRQDLANSVPNSVFLADGSRENVEFLATSANSEAYAARYRDKNYIPYDNLKLNNDSSFDVFADYVFADDSEVPNYVSIGTTDSDTLRADMPSLSSISPTGAVAEVTDHDTATGEYGSPITTFEIDSSHTSFSSHSAYYRVYFFDEIIGYECDSSEGYLYRYSGYDSISTSSTFSTRSGSVEPDRIISDLVSCEFSLIGGTVYNAPSLRVKLEIGDSTESIQLIDTILLSNAS